MAHRAGEFDRRPAQARDPVGSSGANSTPSFYARLLNATLGTSMRIVVGYPGQTDVYLAMERGEVDGFPSMFFNT